MVERDDDAASEEILVGGRSTVSRLGNTVFRQAAPWSVTTAALLKHLEQHHFDHAPRLVGTGFDAAGREMLTYVEGTSIHPAPWSDDALPVLGEMLRKLHTATASFVCDEPVWRPWFGRSLGQPSVIGHCDTGSWNIICRDGQPVALIDWEEAGPVDPMVELAQACWLNAQLFDDDIARMQGLGTPESRGRQVRLLLDGYGLPRSQRAGFVDRIRDFAVLSAANEATEAGVTPETTDATALWGVTWRARSAAWIVRHRDTLDRIILAPS